MIDRNKRKVILLSENQELYNSFRRAFHYLVGIETVFNKYEHTLTSNDAFLLDAIVHDKKNKVIADLRLKNILCPIVVLTYDSREDFYVDTAVWYVKIPFQLIDVIDLIEFAEPIPKKESMLSLMCWLSRASHDIRGLLASPDGVLKSISIMNNIYDAFKDKIPRQTVEDKRDIMNELSSGVYDPDTLSKSIMLLFSKLYETVK